MSSLSYVVGAATATVMLYFYDQHTSRRIRADLPYLEAIRADATTMMWSASTNHPFSVRNSERSIFDQMQREAAWVIGEHNTYFRCWPLLRVLYATPTDAKQTMRYCMVKILIEDDGDFYPSYSEFMDRHK
jgi:sulfatase maturation enzyme AslB (radical SAM superfamily)